MLRITIPIALSLMATLAPQSSFAQIRVGRQSRIDLGPGDSFANETTLSGSPADPSVAVAGWNDFRNGGRTMFAVTRDGGMTWAETNLRPPIPYQTNSEGDPMTAFDERTGTLWAGGISFFTGGAYAARLDPGEQAFQPTQMIDPSPGVDKGWMAAGPSPTDPTRTNVYAAYNLGVTRSTDMGNTWQGPVPLGQGVGFLPKTGPNGELYIAYSDLDTKHILRRSFDGGQTFGPPITIADRMDAYGILNNAAIAGDFRTPAFQGLAVDQATGHLYCVFADTTSVSGQQRDVDIYFTKSTDRGVTWAMPTVINADAPFEQDQFFPWIEVDESGGLHVIYLDTRHNAQFDGAPSALLDAYYAYSPDDGVTWSEHRLTPASWSSADIGLNFPFIGDYIGLSVRGGRAIVVYPVTSPATGADIFSNVVLHGPAQIVCRGILCPCGNDDPKAGCGNSGIDGDPATGAGMVGAGSPRIANDDLAIEVTGLAPNQFGLTFASLGRGSAVIGNGRLCIGGSLNRYPVRQADPGGRLQVGPGEVIALALAASASFPPSPGETWYYQTLYRDVSGPCGAGFNATNAISVLWE